MKISKAIVAPVLASMLLFGACATEDHGSASKTAPTTGTNADVPDASSTAPTEGSNADVTDATEDTTEDDSDTQIAKFGETFTYSDGVTLTVSKPVRFKPTESAAGAEGGGVPVKFTITVVNATSKPMDASDFYASVQSGDGDAEEVYDGDNGLNGSPETKVLPGRQAKWQAGFMVKNPKDIVFDMSSINYDDAIFTNAS